MIWTQKPFSVVIFTYVVRHDERIAKSKLTDPKICLLLILAFFENTFRSCNYCSSEVTNLFYNGPKIMCKKNDYDMTSDPDNLFGLRETTV